MATARYMDRAQLRRYMMSAPQSLFSAEIVNCRATASGAVAVEAGHLPYLAAMAPADTFDAAQTHQRRRPSCRPFHARGGAAWK